MGIFSKDVEAVGIAANNIFKGVESIIDASFTSKEEKATALARLAKLQVESKEEENKQITTRHANDMKSDSKLAKNIRPYTLIFTLGVISLLAGIDGNVGSITIKETYITLFASLLMLQFGFYYGSRGVEKIAEKVSDVFKKRKDK